MKPAATPNLAASAIAELKRALAGGRTRALDLLAEAEDNHRRHGEALNPYKAWSPELARQQAVAADAAIAAGAETGLLMGLPVAIKDVFGVRGLPTFAGTSRPLGERWEVEGPIVSAFRNQLAVFPGKVHTVEFALGVIGTNPHWGTPRNPWDAKHHRVSGGSTSGGGVCLHEGTAVLVLGSDAGGSIRIPASLTGCVGIRTSIGRFPVGGTPPLAPSLDTPGLIARTVEDLAIGCAAIDPSLGQWTELVEDIRRSGIAGLTIGLADACYWEGCGPGVAETVRRALAELEWRGVRLQDVPIPESRIATEFAAIGGLTVPEVYSFIRSEFPGWIDTIDPNVWNRLSSLGDISAAEYLERRRVVRRLIDSLDGCFDNVNIIAMPTTPITAPTVEEVSTAEGYRSRNVLMGRNAYLANLADMPAVTVVAGLDPIGLPVGLQLCGRRMSEPALLRVAGAVEAVLGRAGERIGKPALVGEG